MNHAGSHHHGNGGDKPADEKVSHYSGNNRDFSSCAITPRNYLRIAASSVKPMTVATRSKKASKKATASDSPVSSSESNADATTSEPLLPREEKGTGRLPPKKRLPRVPRKAPRQNQRRKDLRKSPATRRFGRGLISLPNEDIASISPGTRVLTGWKQSASSCRKHLRNKRRGSYRAPGRAANGLGSL